MVWLVQIRKSFQTRAGITFAWASVMSRPTFATRCRLPNQMGCRLCGQTHTLQAGVIACIYGRAPLVGLRLHRD